MMNAFADLGDAVVTRALLVLSVVAVPAVPRERTLTFGRILHRCGQSCGSEGPAAFRHCD